MSRRYSGSDIFWLSAVPATLLGLGGLAIMGRYWFSRDKRRKQSMIGNMHILQHHLHSYAMNHNENFPLRITALVDEGYMPWFPENPYVGGPIGEVKPGCRLIPGGFSYLPLRDKTSGEIVAATLIGYSKSPCLRMPAFSALPYLPNDLPYAFCRFAETTGFLPENMNDMELAS